MACYCGNLEVKCKQKIKKTSMKSRLSTGITEFIVYLRVVFK